MAFLERNNPRWIKYVVPFSFVFVIFAITFIWNPEQRQIQIQILPNRLDNSTTELLPNRAEYKKILLWTTFFGHDDFYFGLGHEPFLRHQCAVTACQMTTDRSLLNSSDVVVFHFREANPDDLPRWRQPKQRWIFFLLESPENTSPDTLKSFDHLFNWTMTYRLDSDIITTYGTSTKISSTAQRPTKPSSIKRRRLAVWLVSNCKTKGKREEYVEELQRHMHVDVYGACAKNETRRTCPEESCGAALYRSHKFYLAFENSVCRDYVTEKFFKALRHGIVPVVYGGADYERMAPPGSYVDVRDFESPRHLAEYLKAVDANDTLYEKYFDWTADWEVGSDWDGERDFCRLCAALHRPLAGANIATKVYDDIATWWAGSNVCDRIKVRG